MTAKVFQDYYTDEVAHCFGCGRLNKHGLQIKSHWDGEESVCRFQPEDFHSGGIPGNVYGGLIASLMDCHGAGTASAAKHREDGGELGTGALPRFVTASLHVDYLAPTPMDTTLEVRGRVKELKGRKAIVSLTLTAKGKICAKGEVVMVELPEDVNS